MSIGNGIILGVYRLSLSKPHVGYGSVWNVFVYRLCWCTSESGHGCIVCSVCFVSCDMSWIRVCVSSTSSEKMNMWWCLVIIDACCCLDAEISLPLGVLPWINGNRSKCIRCSLVGTIVLDVTSRIMDWMERIKR